MFHKRYQLHIDKLNYASFQVFVGGLELNKRANALAVGMKSADKSFKGCLRNMEADGKLLGFPNARVTQGVLPNCMWSFTCSKHPCVSGAVCSQYGVDSFRCECDKPVCVNTDVASKFTVCLHLLIVCIIFWLVLIGGFVFQSSSKTSLPIALEILHLNSVHVMEGENVVITTDNINLILDHAKYGIRDAGVAIYITQLPHHGSMNIGSSDIVSGNADYNTVFTLLDLSNEKVFYFGFPNSYIYQQDRIQVLYASGYIS